MTEASERNAIPVVVNGVTYPTRLDEHGVQRFVGNGAVAYLVQATLNTMILNGLAVEVATGRVSMNDYMAFCTMHGYSVSGFLDAVESAGINHDGFELVVENPLWD